MPHYVETKELFELAKVEVATSLDAIPLTALLDIPPTLMWEHDGKCVCGKRTFLFGLCPKCLEEEAQLREERSPEDDLMFDFPDERAVLTIPEEPVTDLEKKMQPLLKQLSDSIEERKKELQVTETLQGGSKSQQKADTTPLFKTLAKPRVRSGRKTQTVEFLTDTSLRMLLHEGERDRGPAFDGEVRIQNWASSTTLTIPKKAKGDYPFRIAF